MKFNIEIELENGDYCNGCKLLRNEHNFYPLECGLHYELLGARIGAKIHRPEICKEQNKEKTK